MAEILNGKIMTSPQDAIGREVSPLLKPLRPPIPSQFLTRKGETESTLDS